MPVVIFHTIIGVRCDAVMFTFPGSPDRDSYSAVSQDEDDMCIESSWSPCCKYIL